MKKLASFFGIGEEQKEEEDNIDLCECKFTQCACASTAIDTSSVDYKNYVLVEQSVQKALNQGKGKKSKKKS